jgi:phosphoglycerate dehydrogenase-like enzyme
VKANSVAPRPSAPVARAAYFMNEFRAKAPASSQLPSSASGNGIDVPLESNVASRAHMGASTIPRGQLNAAGSGTMKPSAAFLLPAESFESVYGDGERAELSTLMAFVDPLPDASQRRLPADHFPAVETLFTGWYSPRLDAALLNKFPSLRIVFHAGGSVKSIVTDHFWDRGVRLACTARANAIPVAEFTLAQIILSLKHAWRSARATQNNRRFVRNDAAVPSCYGSVVGIISVGLIGRMVAERLRHLDVRVICFDPFLSARDAIALEVEPCTLEEVFARSDVVTCHAPLLAETTHLLRESHFASMKPGATFINTARGAIVHEPEMVAVLARRPDLFAALDVTDPEPPLENSPLFDLPNVLITPHIAGSIGPECHRMGRMIVDEVRRYLAGQSLLGEVLRENLPLLA